MHAGADGAGHLCGGDFARRGVKRQGVNHQHCPEHRRGSGGPRRWCQQPADPCAGRQWVTRCLKRQRQWVSQRLGLQALHAPMGHPRSGPARCWHVVAAPVVCVACLYALLAVRAAAEGRCGGASPGPYALAGQAIRVGPVTQPPPELLRKQGRAPYSRQSLLPLNPLTP